MSETPYADFIRLANFGPEGTRHVRTPEGAAFFNLPIGSPISEALYQQIKAQHKAKGSTWPKGMTTKNANKVETGGFGSHNVAGGSPAEAAQDAAQAAAHNIPAPAKPPAPGEHVASPHPGAAAAPEAPHVPVPPQKPSPVQSSSLDGPNKFSVGTVKYSAPAGSRIYVPTNNSGIVFVVTPDGEVHSFNAKGEIQVEDPIVKSALAAKFTPDFQGDQHFTMGQFDPIPGEGDLASVPVGGTLNNDKGDPQFTKSGPDEWTHNALGITMSSSDVQPFINSGELTVGTAEPGKTEEGHVDFSSMDQPTFTSTLAGYKEGQKLYWGGTELKKTGPDQWSNGKNNATAGDLWFVKNKLSDDKIHSTEDHVEPGQQDTPAAANNPVPEPGAEVPGQSDPKTPAEKPAAAPKPEASQPPAEPASPKEDASTAAGEPKTPEHTPAQDLKPGDKITHVSQLNGLAGGSTIQNEAGLYSTGVWQKKSSGMFQKQPVWQHSETKATAGSHEFHNSINSGKISLKEHGKPEDKTSSETPKAPAIKSPLEGKGVQDLAKNHKTATTDQSLDGKPVPGHPNSTYEYAPGATIKTEKPAVDEGFKHGDPLKLNQLKDVPVGKGVTWSYTAPSGSGTGNDSMDFRKTGEDSWQRVKTHPSMNPPVWSTAELAQNLSISKNKKLTFNDHPSEDVKGPEKSAETPKTFADLKHGEPVTAEHIDQMKAGDQLKVKGESTAVKTKQEDGSFLHHHIGSPNEAKVSNLQANELKKFTPNGSLLKHEPSPKETPKVPTKEDKAPQIPKESVEAPAPKTVEPNATHESEPAQPPAETKAPQFSDLKHGDQITGDHIDQMKVGDHLALKNGVTYKKTGDTSWSGAATGTDTFIPSDIGNGDLKYAADFGSASKHVPAEATKNPNASLAVGDTVGSVEHLTQMPPATVLDFTKKDGSIGQYTKLPNGNWLNPGGVQYEAHSFAQGIKAGKFKVSSYPSEHGVTPSDQNAHTLIPGGKVYSHEDLASALNALQNHPSHQIAYGLKSLDEKNLLHESHGNQNELKIGAASEFPNLKGKPGAIALLKKKLGIQENPEHTHVSSSNEEKVSISAGDAKHEFTKAEIDGALKILNGYNGKLWANELSKQGSPLGDIKWNDAIGFHKDKLEGKKEAIKLLEEKSKQFQAEVTPLNPSIIGKSHLTAAEKAQLMNHLEKVAPGTSVYPEYAPEASITKGDDGLWVSSVTQGKLTSAELTMLGPYSATPIEKKAEASPEAPKVESGLKPGDTMTLADLHAAAPGTLLHWDSKDGGSQPYDAVKDENGNWVTNSGMAIPTAQWKAATESKYVTLKGLPEITSQDSTHKTNPTFEEFTNAPVGTKAGFVFSSGSQATYIKQPDQSWIKTDDSTQTPRKVSYFKTFFDVLHGGSPKGAAVVLDFSDNKQALPDYARAPEAVTSKANSTDLEADTGHNQSGILPGKWTSTSGKYMIVNADGSGTFYSKDGSSQPISAAKVKILHDQTMSQYEGIPETTPTSHVEPVAAAPIKTTPAPKKNSAGKTKLPDVSLADGTYYLGPKNDYDTTVYQVKGNEVTITHNKGVKDGQTETVPLSKVKTNFLAGKILDENGNSVLPEGHAGSLTMWNSPMTTAALIEAKKFLETKNEQGFFHQNTQMELKKLGFYVSPSSVVGKVNAANPGHEFGPTYGLNYNTSGHTPESPWHVEAAKVVLAQIDQFLKHVDNKIPDSNAKGNFDWTANGEAIMPASTVGPVQDALNAGYYNTKEVTAAFQAIKKAFGPKVLGGVTLNKQQKNSWVKAYSEGNFKGMYQVEVAAASAKNLAHPSGYMHPGYEGNAETHQISWSAAIPGELKAGSDVPGEWSQVAPSQWSKEELSNYLISAQMQNPEHLSLAEQRQWVTAHKAGQKLKADALSIKALEHKNSGAAPLSEPPVWSDNIVPAKLYDHLFDDGPFPTSDKWTPTPYEVSQAWAKDNWDNAEFQNTLKELYPQYAVDHPEFGLGDYPMHMMENAVGKYFDDKHAEYQAELLKPVYSHVKVLAGGSHDVHLYQDQFGKKYVFKPSDDAHIFRAESEAAAGKLSNMWGFNTPKTDIKTLEVPGKGEQIGLFQNFQESVSDFLGPNGKGIDLTTLTNKQLGQLASEHVLDWALDNDDAHEQNMLITPNGDLVGIDKGRGFRAYGNWNGLAGDAKAHTNMLPGSQLAYTPLYDGIRNGSISKEQADAAYLAALKAAERIKKSDDAAVAALIHEGVANRKNWAVPGYMNHFDHKQAPTNADDLVKAVLARKNSMDEQITAMWAKIYKDAGLGDLPKPPPYVLGEQHLSGFQEAHTFDKVATTKVWGSAPIHASAEFQGGHSLLWTEKGKDGEDLHFGSFKVAPLSQEKLIQFIEPKAGAEATGPVSKSVAGFPNLTEWKSAFSHAGKDITKNAIDKNFDAEIQKKFEETKQAVQTDLSHWKPDLQPNEEGKVVFPSGHEVPVGALDQYKLALAHNADMAQKVEDAKASGTTTNKTDFSVLPAYEYAAEPQVYHNEDASLGTYKQLSTGAFVHTSPDSQLSVVKELPAEVKAGDGGWSLQGEQTNKAEQDPVLYHKASAGDGIGTLAPGGIKTQQDGWGSQGHQGKEYEITLPTGEKIWFRDSGKTSTATSQSGTLKFKLAGSDQAASMARIESHLQTMGLNTEGADEHAAENVYWRNMFDRVINSNVNGAPEKVKAARKTLLGMRESLAQQLGKSSYDISDKNIIEAIGLTRSQDAEHEFWTNLANETFGPDKVSAWISAGKHLPQYSHMDLTNPEATTGKPYWDRIDVSHEELQAKNALIAIGNSGKDNSLLNYITSGGMLSTEERLRVLGYWKDGASSSSDQGTGGATGVFTRIAAPGTSAEKSGAIYGAHVAYWNPKVLAQTGTYSYGSDMFGNVENQAGSNYYNPLKSLSTHTGNGNETLIQHQLSILDHLEIMVFSDPTKRNEAIQRMKEMGHDTLRGVPIEDRLIMKQNLDNALKVVKAAWTQQ